MEKGDKKISCSSGGCPSNVMKIQIIFFLFLETKVHSEEHILSMNIADFFFMVVMIQFIEYEKAKKKTGKCIKTTNYISAFYHFCHTWNMYSLLGYLHLYNFYNSCKFSES